METDSNQPTQPTTENLNATVPAAGSQPTQPVTPVQSTPPTQNSQKVHSSKMLILLMILFVLVVGMVAYMYFAKQQSNVLQTNPGENTTIVAPSPTVVVTPTPASVEEIMIETPETDLQDLDSDLQGL